MRKRSGLGFDSKIFHGVEWFQSGTSSIEELQSPFFVQDHVHRHKIKESSPEDRIEFK